MATLAVMLVAGVLTGRLIVPDSSVTQLVADGATLLAGHPLLVLLVTTPWVAPLELGQLVSVVITW
jgi:hypothetical protein